MHTFRTLPRLALLLTAGAALLAVPAQADLIFFKDGFVIEGLTIREGKAVVEGGESVWMPQGFFYVDDFARRTYFSPLQIQEPTKKEINREGEVRSKLATIYPPGTSYLPPIRDVLQIEDWDNDKWERRITMRTSKGRTAVIQKITAITPQCVRTDTRNLGNYRWAAFYLTNELGPKAVQGLLSAHPDFKITKDTSESEAINRRFKVYEFFVRASWFDEADSSLQAIGSDYPSQKEKVDQYRANIRKFRAQQTFDEIKQARSAGQHRLAQQRVDKFSEEGLDEKLITEFRDLRGKYEAAQANLETARRLLKDLPEKVEVESLARFHAVAAATVGNELTLDEFLPPPREVDKPRLGRLETFLTLARQAEAQEKEGQKPRQGPSELLSLAISGWVLGGKSAEEKFETAQRLWQAREFALAYQRTLDAGKRARMLNEYQKGGSNVVPVDEMAQIIGFLPPPEPVEKISTETVELQAGRSGMSYLLRLPPEYSHSRPEAYPVVIVLHQGGERARDMIERWSKLSAERGYILAAPAWEQGLRTTYSYTAKEHDEVLEVLRDLRRRFQVDPDRVFLHGFGEGGNMAYDVGLSHPDLFAGVLPMAARPQWFATKYWPNAQYLPFYVVGGDYCELDKPNREQFENWVPRGYPTVYVVYRGRGPEWFSGELPRMFDWMDRKVRANPLLEVGRIGGLGERFHTMRQTDNHFYWLSTDELLRGSVNDASAWSARIYAATLQARLTEGNQLNVTTTGVKQVSVWLGRGTTLDFDKPITVYVNLARQSVKVTPNLATLLEDLWVRGDRQRPYVARLDFNVAR